MAASLNFSQGHVALELVDSGGASAADVANNTANIVTNTANIANNEARIITNEGTLSTHTTQIANNAAQSDFNYLINAGFDIWQRGTSFVTVSPNTFVADRWHVFYTGATPGTFTISRETFDPDQTDVPDGLQYYLKWDQTVAGTLYLPRLRQRIFDNVIRETANQSVTFSYWSRAASAETVTTRITIERGTSTLILGDQTANVTTSWQQFDQVFSPPVLPAAITEPTYVEVELRLPANDTFDIDIARLMFVKNTIPPPEFKRNGGSIRGEISECERFFEKSYNLEVDPGTVTGVGVVGGRDPSTADTYIHTTFKTRKWDTPTVTIYSPASGSTGVWRETVTNLDRSGTIADEGEHGFMTIFGAFGSTNLRGHFTADAESTS